ncbi:MAG: PAS domain S-box protein [Candidatus Krumholzibacteria bacterium]|nr:PAS domain S-box protein [Candidatus Krumholzibacteria bacterium]
MSSQHRGKKRDETDAHELIGEEGFRTIYEHAPVMIDSFDDKGRCLLWNRECEKNLGWTIEEIRDCADPLALTYPDPKTRDRVLNTIKKADGKFREYEVLAKDGSTRTQLWADFRLPDGTLISVGHDITERKSVDRALEEKDERLRTLVEQIPAVLWTTDINLCFTSSEGTGLESLGLKPGQVVGLSLYEYFSTDDPDYLPIEMHRRALRGESVKYDTLWSERVFESHIDPLRDKDGKIIGCLGFALDVTERKKAEAALKDSEVRLRQIIDLVPHMIFAKDKTGRFILVNSAVAEAYGKTVDDLLAFRHVDVHATKQEIEHFLKDDLQVIDSGIPKFIPEESFVDVYGVERILQTTKIPYNVPNTDERAVLGVAVDITERKRAEEKVRLSQQQLRALASRLQEVREEESASIAREIHDELGQTLTGLKLDITWIRRTLLASESSNQGSEIVQRLNSIAGEVDAAIRAVRRIATQLRPVILDDLGLARALEWQTQEFEYRTGIKSVFKMDTGESNLDPERSTAVFRIFQEILTNVARHARAECVRTKLNHDNGFLVLEVVDDGLGISDKDVNSPRALGILGMQERAQVCGGDVVIKRQNGGGTRVTVRIPVD